MHRVEFPVKVPPPDGGSIAAGSIAEKESKRFGAPKAFRRKQEHQRSEEGIFCTPAVTAENLVQKDFGRFLEFCSNDHTIESWMWDESLVPHEVGATKGRGGFAAEMLGREGGGRTR